MQRSIIHLMLRKRVWFTRLCEGLHGLIAESANHVSTIGLHFRVFMDLGSISIGLALCHHNKSQLITTHSARDQAGNGSRNGTVYGMVHERIHNIIRTSNSALPSII